jgi:hypothetical protein
MRKLTIEIEFKAQTSMDALLNRLRAEIMKTQVLKNGHTYKEAIGMFKIEEIEKYEIPIENRN